MKSTNPNPDWHWEHAPAKINLALHVTGQRDDGYHLLDTLVVFTEMGDRLSAVQAVNDSLSLTGPRADDVPIGPDNLVLKALSIVRDILYEMPDRTALGIDNTALFPLAITLEKHLPTASGIGGGSADAAAAVRLALKLWGVEHVLDRVVELMGRLGADVPMCLRSYPLQATGIGDHLTAVPGLPDLPMILVNPGCAVSTPDVFQALTCRTHAPLHVPDTWPLSIPSLAETLTLMRNDLQAAAIGLQPEIRVVLDVISKTPNCLLARMSGSGATCFGLYPTHKDADDAARIIRRNLPGAWCVSTRLYSRADG